MQSIVGQLSTSTFWIFLPSVCEDLSAEGKEQKEDREEDDVAMVFIEDMRHGGRCRALLLARPVAQRSVTAADANGVESAGAKLLLARRGDEAGT